MTIKENLEMALQSKKEYKIERLGGRKWNKETNKWDGELNYHVVEFVHYPRAVRIGILAACGVFVMILFKSIGIYALVVAAFGAKPVLDKLAVKEENVLLKTASLKEARLYVAGLDEIKPESREVKPEDEDY